jgi:hypothetical protein
MDAMDSLRTKVTAFKTVRSLNPEDCNLQNGHFVPNPQTNVSFHSIFITV